ncbi:ATP-dependent DNA helicase PcrA, partial [Candidatus Peregrinibacteria bacterium CG_4_9_14_0_2_um_filter_53_11]
MGSEFLLQKLNEKQKEAVVTTEGPVLVIAGAGSGKTRALTHRIAYLINEHDIPPENILAVTFTNKAAGEMRDRIIKLLGGEGNVHPSQLPTIGTFHSVCVRILRRHIHLLDFENQFTIYDTSDQQVLMKHIFEEQRINPKELNPRAVLAHISNAKNRLITPAAFEAQATSYFESKVARLYGPYQEGLKKNNAVDFDDILMRTVELFKKHPEVLKEYQERWYYVHVDEYQDTNQAQYLLTNLLAARHRNLYVIGDHDQSIYSWRGANIQNILDFEKDYPEAKIITLEQNYRSTQPILDIAQAVISKNRKRREKTLWTERTEGAKAELYLAENERHEAEVIGQKILDAVRQHEQPDYRDFVVLYRTNAQSRAMEEGFMRMGIPYKIIGGIRFYERKEIKDMISYLRVVSNPADTVALLRIINTPQRKIGPKTVERIQTFAAIKFCSFYEAMRRAEEIEELTGPKKEQVLRFARLIDRLRSRSREVTASAMIKYTLDESGYKKSLDDGSVEGEARLENIAELISVSSKYDKLAPGLSLNIFLEEVSLIADIDSLDEKDNSATLMTMHGAKGLEFPWVFIAGLEEGILPHSRSMLSPEELEEERRLFYVACTRAEERLFLFYTKNRMFYGETK